MRTELTKDALEFLIIKKILLVSTLGMENGE